jgi:peptidoglycan/LPS O-acetylase OafA/YrhL
MEPSDLVESRATPTKAARARVHYLDWLRALAVLGVFFYHSLQPFSTHDWHVKNDHLSGAIDGLISFVDPWGIAFFFLIAGASTFLALRWRTTGQYVGERLMRLLLPLTAAYVLLSPVQAFLAERHYGRYAGAFLSGVPLFFQEVWSNLPRTVVHPLLVGRTYHLWFVVFLLWFSLLGLPMFLWLRGPGGRRLSAWLGERAGRRGATLVFAVPVALVPLTILPLWPEGEDWGTFVYLFGFFVAGYVLMSDPRLMEGVRRDLVPALWMAIVVDTAILLTGVPGFIDRWQEAPSYSWMYAWAYFSIAVQAWAWVHVVLGLGMRARWFRRPLARSVSAAAMPFFLVHQPVILAIAFFVVRWDAGIPAKWAVVVLGSFVLSAVLATALARLPLVSTMFGVKRATRSGAPRRSRPLPIGDLPGVPGRPADAEPPPSGR